MRDPAWRDLLPAGRRARRRCRPSSRAIRSRRIISCMSATTATVLLPFTQAKQVLDRLKKLCIGRDLPDAGACARFDQRHRATAKT